MCGSVGTTSSIDSECGLKLRKNKETFALLVLAALLQGRKEIREGQREKKDVQLDPPRSLRPFSVDSAISDW